MKRGSLAPEESDWDEPDDPGRPGRRHAARGAEARGIVERLAWTGWPWAFWVGSGPGPSTTRNPPPAPESDFDWVRALEPAEATLGRRFYRQPAGGYAVRLSEGAQKETKDAGDGAGACELLRRSNFTVAEALPLATAVVAGPLRLSDSRRFDKALFDLVGEPGPWRLRKEDELRDVRAVVDAAAAWGREREAESVGAGALILEASCLWIGDETRRPSRRLEAVAVAEAVRADEADARRGDGLPVRWREAAWALLGQRRFPIKPPAGRAGWYRCGRALPGWPLDVLLHVGRALGGPNVLAGRVAAAPALAGAPAGDLLRERLLTCGGIRECVQALPALLTVCRRLGAEPSRRLGRATESQREAIQAAVAATSVTGDVVWLRPGADPAAAARAAFWRCYAGHLAAAGPDGAPAPRPPADESPSSLGQMRHLYHLLAGSGLGAEALGFAWHPASRDLWRLDRDSRRLLTRASAKDAPSPGDTPITFENLAAYACDLLWRAGRENAPADPSGGAWQTIFLIAAARAGCLAAQAVAGAAQWAKGSCAAGPPGPDSGRHLSVAVAGLLEVRARADAAGMDDDRRAAAFEALGRHARRLLADVGKPVAGEPAAVLPAAARSGIRFLCAAVAAGLDARRADWALECDLTSGVEAALSVAPARAGDLLDWVERLVPRARRPTPGQRALLAEWGLTGRASRVWGYAFALLDPALVARYADWARRLPGAAPALAGKWEPVALMRWLFELALPPEYGPGFPCPPPGAEAPKGGRPAGAKLAFLSRHAGRLLAAAEALLARPAAKEEGEPADAARQRLAHWQRCAEIACEWADLRLADAPRLFERLTDGYEPRAARSCRRPFDLYGGEPLRAVLRVCDGRPERALVLGTAKLDLSWEEAAQVARAWECVEPLGEVRDLVGSAAGTPRRARRALDWLARLGFCLRLQREERLREKLRAVVGPPDGGPAGLGPPAPLPAGLDWADVPPEHAGSLRRLLWLTAGGPLPDRLVQALGRPARFREELETLRGRPTLSVSAQARALNLRDLLRDPPRLRKWVEADLRDGLAEALGEAMFKALERAVEDVTAGHIRKIIGTTPPRSRAGDAGAPAGEDAGGNEGGDEGRNWDNAARLYFSLRRNRKALKRLMWHEARGERDWLRDHPPNRRFLQRVAGAGVDADAWLGAFGRTVPTPLGPWRVEVETDPLHVLRMGNYFGTCLGEGREYAYATVANACEANKRVLYVRDDRGEVIGRKLLVMTPQGQVLGFRSYGMGPLDPWSDTHAGRSPWMKVHLDAFCREWADVCRARLHPFPGPGAGDVDPRSEQGLSLFAHWYNDSPEPFDPAWLAHGPADLRGAAAGGGPAFDSLLGALRAGGDEEALPALRTVVWLGDDALPLVRAFVDSTSRAGEPGTTERVSAVLRFIARHGLPGRVRRLAEGRPAAP